MTSIQLPRIDELASCSEAAQVEVLGLLFEPSPAIHSLLLPLLSASVYSSYSALVDACGVHLSALAAKSSTPGTLPPSLLSLLASHPRLGEPKPESALSAAEQASLEGESDKLMQLNHQYEERFPGLRYVVFVNGRQRADIMRDMKARINRANYSLEVNAAITVSKRCSLARCFIHIPVTENDDIDV